MKNPIQRSSQKPLERPSQIWPWLLVVAIACVGWAFGDWTPNIEPPSSERTAVPAQQAASAVHLALTTSALAAPPPSAPRNTSQPAREPAPRYIADVADRGSAAPELPVLSGPRIGIAAPESMELPPGYLRYYQFTGDGQSLEPILIFGPDYRPVDAWGQPAMHLADRVVPPHLAPPGWPIRQIEMPARLPSPRLPPGQPVGN